MLTTLTRVQTLEVRIKKTTTQTVVPMIYIAAAFSEPDPVANTKHAIRIADALLKAGFTPLVPHLTMLWDIVSPKSYETWIDYDCELRARCDAVLRVPATRSERLAKRGSPTVSISPSSVPAPPHPKTACGPSSTGRCSDDLFALFEPPLQRRRLHRESPGTLPGLLGGRLLGLLVGCRGCPSLSGGSHLDDRTRSPPPL